MSYPLIRDIHGYLGMTLAAFLALYAWTGYLIVHGGGRPPREIARTEVPVTPLRGADEALARVEAEARRAAEQAGVEGGAVRSARFSQGAWRVQVARVATFADVRIAPGADRAQVGLFQFRKKTALTQLHHLNARDARGVRWAWALAIDVASVALIAFAVTGLLLFLALKRKRRLGWILLAASTLYTLASVAHLMTGAP